MELIVVILVIAVAVLVVILAQLQQRKRRHELLQFATSRQWRFESARDYGLEDRYPRFDVFSRGHSRYAYNTIRGQASFCGEPWPVCMGDYHYRETSGSGKSRHTRTYRFSYLVLDLPYDCSCELKIRQEGLFDKLASMVGFDDIDFESAEFSDKFHVKCTNKKFAYDVIHPRMMEFLLSQAVPTIMIAGRACCLYHDNRCWPPERFLETLEWSQGFFDLWPRYLVADLTTRS